MPPPTIATMSKYFGQVKDPRVERTKKHKLLDIMVISICGVICGGDSWTEIELFGKAKHDWLASFLELPNGIPSHDTFGRVFAALDPAQFEQAFVSWIQAVHQVTAGEIIAIDGKQLRHSYDQSAGQAAIHMVNAWAVTNHVVLGQEKVATKSNEITAIPKLLEKLALNGCIVTIDAMGCQRAIAEQVLEQGGAYLLALKENQGHLYQDVVGLFESAHKIDFRGVAHDYCRTVNKGHGRIESRACWVITELAHWGCIRKLDAWPQLNMVVKVQAERRIAETVSQETRYYISSLNSSAALALEAVRGHWGIENGLHWVLDVVFQEDACRVRQGDAAENLAILRQIALNLLKQEPTLKVGVKAKRLRAGWDERYLRRVLSALAAPN